MTVVSKQKSSFLDKLHYYLYLISFVFAFAGIFTLPKGHEVIEILVILSLSVGVLNYAINRRALLTDSKLLFAIVLTVGLVIIINHYIHGDWPRYGRAFFYLSAFILLRPQIPCIQRVVFYSVAIGGVLLGLLSLYQFNTGMLRVEGFTNAIPFAQGLFVLLLFNCYFFFSTKGAIRYIPFVSSIFLLIGLYLSQTRGVWLALLILLAVYLILKAFKKPFKYLVIMSFLAVIAFSSYENSGFVRDKVAAGVSDLQRAKDGNFGSSWGLRIVAWDSAVKGIRDNPLLGVGRDNFTSTKEEQVARGEVSKLALNPALFHTHNQYLQSMLIRGIPGAVALFLLFAYPWLQSGLLNRKDYLFKSISISFMIFSLSDVPFEHLNTIYLYVLSMALLRYFSLESDGLS